MTTEFKDNILTVLQVPFTDNIINSVKQYEILKPQITQINNDILLGTQYQEAENDALLVKKNATAEYETAFKLFNQNAENTINTYNDSLIDAIPQSEVPDPFVINENIKNYFTNVNSLIESLDELRALKTTNEDIEAQETAYTDALTDFVASNSAYNTYLTNAGIDSLLDADFPPVVESQLTASQISDILDDYTAVLDSIAEYDTTNEGLLRPGIIEAFTDANDTYQDLRFQSTVLSTIQDINADLYNLLNNYCNGLKSQNNYIDIRKYDFDRRRAYYLQLKAYKLIPADPQDPDYETLNNQYLTLIQDYQNKNTLYDEKVEQFNDFTDLQISFNSLFASFPTISSNLVNVNLYIEEPENLETLRDVKEGAENDYNIAKELADSIDLSSLQTQFATLNPQYTNLNTVLNLYLTSLETKKNLIDTIDVILSKLPSNFSEIISKLIFKYKNFIKDYVVDRISSETFVSYIFGYIRFPGVEETFVSYIFGYIRFTGVEPNTTDTVSQIMDTILKSLIEDFKTNFIKIISYILTILVDLVIQQFLPITSSGDAIIKLLLGKLNTDYISAITTIIKELSKIPELSTTLNSLQQILLTENKTGIYNNISQFLSELKIYLKNPKGLNNISYALSRSVTTNTFISSFVSNFISEFIYDIRSSSEVVYFFESFNKFLNNNNSPVFTLFINKLEEYLQTVTGPTGISMPLYNYLIMNIFGIFGDTGDTGATGDTGDTGATGDTGVLTLKDQFELSLNNYVKEVFTLFSKIEFYNIIKYIVLSLIVSLSYNLKTEINTSLQYLRFSETTFKVVNDIVILFNSVNPVSFANTVFNNVKISKNISDINGKDAVNVDYLNTKAIVKDIDNVITGSIKMDMSDSEKPAYLYIGDNWRIRTSAGGATLLFEYNANPTDVESSWSIVVPFQKP